LVAAITIAGVILALAAASIGRNKLVICGRGTILERIAQSVTSKLGAGVVDGAHGSYCTVPSTASWVLAGAILLAFVALALIVGHVAARRRLPGPPDSFDTADPVAAGPWSPVPQP